VSDRKNQLIFLLILLLVGVVGVIFWPSGGLYFERGKLEGQNAILQEEVKELDSLMLIRAYEIDSLERSGTDKLEEVKLLEEKLNDVQRYYKKRYATIRNASPDSAISVARSILDGYSTD